MFEINIEENHDRGRDIGSIWSGDVSLDTNGLGRQSESEATSETRTAWESPKRTIAILVANISDGLSRRLQPKVASGPRYWVGEACNVAGTSTISCQRSCPLPPNSRVAASCYKYLCIPCGVGRTDLPDTKSTELYWLLRTERPQPAVAELRRSRTARTEAVSSERV
jgi:hypothetical protein